MGDLPRYEVRAGDRLGDIAERFLGDASRYPLIRDANTHLIPDIGGPHGPDHIRIGWLLRLPSEARDHGTRPHATGPTTTEPVRHPQRPSRTNASPRSPESLNKTPRPRRPRPRRSSPARAPTDTSTNSQPTAPTPTAADDSNHEGEQPADGIQLPGGWLSIPFAVALLAAAGTVWLRRRYEFRYPDATEDTHPDRQDGLRFEAEHLDDDLQPLPDVVSLWGATSGFGR